MRPTLILWACATLMGSAQAFSQNDTLTGGVFREAIITADAPKRHTEGLQMGMHTRHKIMTDVKYAYDRLKGNGEE